MDEMEMQLAMRGLRVVEFMLDAAIAGLEPIRTSAPGSYASIVEARNEAQNVLGYMGLCQACRAQGQTVMEGIKNARAAAAKQGAKEGMVTSGKG